MEGGRELHYGFYIGMARKEAHTTALLESFLVCLLLFFCVDLWSICWIFCSSSSSLDVQMLTLTFEVILSEIIRFSIYTSGNRGVRRMSVLVSFHLVGIKDSYLKLLREERVYLILYITEHQQGETRQELEAKPTEEHSLQSQSQDHILLSFWKAWVYLTSSSSIHSRLPSQFK